MLWITSGDQLVCRWISGEESEQRVEVAAVETDVADVVELPNMAIGKAA